MKRSLLLLLVVLSLVVVGCGKKPSNMTFEEKVATLPPKLQPLFKGPWKVDVNASSARTSKAAEGKSGIKGDIKFDKDVGKAAQFLAKTLTFGFEKGTLTRVYGEKYGEGILSTEETGFLTVDDGAHEPHAEERQGHRRPRYTIEELVADEKLVLVPKAGGAYQVLIPKGNTPMAAPPSDPKAAPRTTAAPPPRARREVQEDLLQGRRSRRRQVGVDLVLHGDDQGQDGRQLPGSRGKTARPARSP